MKKTVFFIVMATLLFSSIEICLKLMAGHLAPLQTTFLRFFVGGIVLLPFAIKSLKTKNLILKKEDYLFYCGMGFLCVVVTMFFYQISIVNGTASTVAVLFSCNPVFVMVFSFIFLKEKITNKQAIAMAISLIGMMVFMDIGRGIDLYGAIFALIAGMIFALYSVLSKKRSQAFGGMVTTAFSFVMGSVQLLVILTLFKLPFIAPLLEGSVFYQVPILDGITLSILPLFLFVSIGCTGLGYMFYFRAMEMTLSTNVSLIFFLKPIVAMAFAMIFLHEVPTPAMLYGMLIILVGSGYMFCINVKNTKEVLAVEN